MGQSLSRLSKTDMLRLGCGVAALVGMRLALRADCDLRTNLAYIPRHHYRGLVVWVTGASSGIGRALCEELARQGAELIITSRRADVLDELATQLLRLGARSVRVVQADLAAGGDAAEDAARRALATHGGHLDVLINNAGVSTRCSAAALEMDGVRHVMELNYFAPVAIARACLPALADSRGLIINTSSISSVVATPMRSSYCASKAALDAYFEALRYEQPRVRILTLCPGSTRTDVSINAVVPGGKTWGKRDADILHGLPPRRVAERALAAAACGINVAWVAARRELMGTRIAQYWPDVWERIAPAVFKGYAERLEQGGRPV